MGKQLIIYRGPLERSRLALLVPAITAAGTTTFIWVYPLEISERKQSAFKKLMAQFKLAEIKIFKDSFPKNYLINSKLKRYSDAAFEVIHFIGFRSFYYSLPFKTQRKIWYVNGIPEEILLHGTGLINRLKCKLQWNSLKSRKAPDVIVPVSEPMGKLLRKRLYDSEIFVVPITVDTDIFIDYNNNKRYLTYLGTGAPWQALDLLEDLWFHLFKQDNTLVFRVISKDPRTTVLGKRIPVENIEFVASSDFKIIAGYLNEALLGFLIRRNILVNNVSFPTKYGEYIASGAHVVLSNIDWDLNKYSVKHETGVIVNLERSPDAQADAVLTFLRKISVDAPKKVNLKAAADELSNANWVGKLTNRIIALKA